MTTTYHVNAPAISLTLHGAAALVLAAISFTRIPALPAPLHPAEPAPLFFESRSTGRTQANPGGSGTPGRGPAGVRKSQAARPTVETRPPTPNLVTLPPIPGPAEPAWEPDGPIEGDTGSPGSHCPDCASGSGGAGDGIGLGGGAGAGTGDGIGDGSGGTGAAEQALYLNGTILPPELLDRRMPQYPELARLAREEGVVLLQITVERDGTVGEITILRSASLFDHAAIAAVRQWKYRPAMLGDRPVRVYLTVRVEFRLK